MEIGSELSKSRKLAGKVIDDVEYAIRMVHPDIDLKATSIVVDGEKPNTLLHGEAYYDLENAITERIDGLGLIIDREDVAEAFKYEFDREPSDEELNEFLRYIEVDVPQWLRDNARSYEV